MKEHRWNLDAYIISNTDPHLVSILNNLSMGVCMQLLNIKPILKKVQLLYIWKNIWIYRYLWWAHSPLYPNTHLKNTWCPAPVRLLLLSCTQSFGTGTRSKLDKMLPCTRTRYAYNWTKCYLVRTLAIVKQKCWLQCHCLTFNTRLTSTRCGWSNIWSMSICNTPVGPVPCTCFLWLPKLGCTDYTSAPN